MEIPNMENMTLNDTPLNMYQMMIGGNSPK
jgi:hypothetical protein